MVGVDNAAVTGDSSTAREMASATQMIASGNQIDAGSNATDALTEAKSSTVTRLFITPVATHRSC